MPLLFEEAEAEDQADFHAWPQMDDNLEEAFRENLSLRRQLMSEVAKAGEPVTLGQKMGKWWRFGRTEDQQLVFALQLVLIAYRPLLLFLVGVGGEPIRMNGVGKFLAYLTNGIFHFLQGVARIHNDRRAYVQ